MAVAPYKFQERRSSFGWSNNQLIEAATQTNQRKSVPLLDYDTQRNISSIGRRVLLSTGRMLYENFGIVKGPINEMARLAVGTFISQYEGENEAWGNLAEAWLQENDKWIDLRGWPYTMAHFRRNLVIAMARDGEMGVLLTQDRAGNPKIQIIPAHRIGCRLDAQIVNYPTDKVDPDGTVRDANGAPIGNMAWQGMVICDGVIQDEYGTTVAYRVGSDNGWDFSVFRDISANDLIVTFLPNYPDQIRGISELAVCAFDCLDVKESRRNEMFAQLLNSCLAVQVYNETGTMDTAQSELTIPGSTPDTTTGAATSLPTEMFRPGTIGYFKAGSGQKVESMVNQRPSTNVMNFQTELIRSAMCGMGWSTDFGIDPTKAGGAQMRIVVEKINARIKEIQELCVGPTCVRVDGWRLSKAIAMGRLTSDKDWYKWTHQGPPKTTADAKYNSDINLQEQRAGLRTMKEITAENGDYWEDVQDQLIAEEKRLQDKCKAAGVDINRIKLLTPNGNANIDAQAQQKDQTQEQP